MGKLVCPFICLLMLAACDKPADPNPLHLKNTGVSAERQAQQQADDEQSRDLARQVIAGEISLDEAACQFHDGEWNDDRELCERHLIRSTDERNRDVTDQSQILDHRVELLVDMSNDADTAKATGSDAAHSFLTNHPENFVGAVRAALSAMRKEKLMPPTSPSQATKLNKVLS